ncbi:hypothetical protein FB451DRAFT_1374624 [Mycena latifolia]|nr:hypothetical protein FB451DRAFT_1374624 [Mycena latifolia]
MRIPRLRREARQQSAVPHFASAPTSCLPRVTTPSYDRRRCSNYRYRFVSSARLLPYPGPRCHDEGDNKGTTRHVRKVESGIIENARPPLASLNASLTKGDLGGRGRHEGAVKGWRRVATENELLQRPHNEGVRDVGDSLHRYSSAPRMGVRTQAECPPRCPRVQTCKYTARTGTREITRAHLGSESYDGLGAAARQSRLNADAAGVRWGPARDSALQDVLYRTECSLHATSASTIQGGGNGRTPSPHRPFEYDDSVVFPRFSRAHRLSLSIPPAHPSSPLHSLPQAPRRRDADVRRGGLDLDMYCAVVRCWVKALKDGARTGKIGSQRCGRADRGCSACRAERRSAKDMHPAAGISSVEPHLRAHARAPWRMYRYRARPRARGERDASGIGSSSTPQMHARDVWPAEHVSDERKREREGSNDLALRLCALNVAVFSNADSPPSALPRLLLPRIPLPAQAYGPSAADAADASIQRAAVAHFRDVDGRRRVCGAGSARGVTGLVTAECTTGMGPRVERRGRSPIVATFEELRVLLVTPGESHEICGAKTGNGMGFEREASSYLEARGRLGLERRDENRCHIQTTTKPRVREGRTFKRDRDWTRDALADAIIGKLETQIAQRCFQLGFVQAWRKGRGILGGYNAANPFDGVHRRMRLGEENELPVVETCSELTTRPEDSGGPGPGTLRILAGISIRFGLSNTVVCITQRPNIGSTKQGTNIAHRSSLHPRYRTQTL